MRTTPTGWPPCGPGPTELIDSTPVAFTGHLTNREVRELYAATDFACFLNCSDGEGVPVAVMEAQAAGMPVVATAAGGTGEIVHDGENGRLVPVEVTAAQVADAVESVMDLSDAQYADMSAQAHATWARMSDAQRQYREFRRTAWLALEGLRSSAGDLPPQAAFRQRRR